MHFQKMSRWACMETRKPSERFWPISNHLEQRCIMRAGCDIETNKSLPTGGSAYGIPKNSTQPFPIVPWMFPRLVWTRLWSANTSHVNANNIKTAHIENDLPPFRRGGIWGQNQKEKSDTHQTNLDLSWLPFAVPFAAPGAWPSDLKQEIYIIYELPHLWFYLLSYSFMIEKSFLKSCFRFRIIV